MRVLFVWPNKDAFGFKPLGLSLLSGIACSLGWETRLFDTTEIDFGYIDNTKSGENAKIFKPVDLVPYGHQKKKIDLESAFVKMIEEFKPDCLAFSVLSDEVFIASRITSIAKKMYPDIKIIWGGKYPTIQPVMTLQTYGADFACVGEGLDAFKDFLNALSGNKDVDLYNIRNIWAKKKGVVIKNDVRPLRKDLDSLSYVDWELFKRPHFYKPFDGNVYVAGDHMLNWGCPYHCTYCINHFYHELYSGSYFMRRYSIRRIIDEVKFLKNKYKLEFLRFHDEDFLMRPLKNMHELSEAYREEVNVPFVIETNPKSVTEEKVKLLKNMNCVSVSFGVETGDPELRNKLLRRVDTEKDIIRAFLLLKDVSIRTSAFVMLGIPFETRKTYEKTVDLIKKADVQYPACGFFYPFEGTELRQIAINEGFFDPGDKQKDIYLRNKPFLNFDEFNEEELVEMRNVFVLYVKLPDCYKPFIKRSEKNDDLGVKLRKKLLKIYDKTVWANNGWYIDDGLKGSYLRELKEMLYGADIDFK